MRPLHANPKLRKACPCEPRQVASWDHVKKKKKQKKTCTRSGKNVDDKWKDGRVTLSQGEDQKDKGLSGFDTRPQQQFLFRDRHEGKRLLKTQMVGGGKKYATYSSAPEMTVGKSLHLRSSH